MGRHDARHADSEPTPRMRSRWPILAIFVLSGAAGLIYEIVWSRQLVLVFGNTTQAISAILAGFFGGLAIGSAVGGRIADRVRSPLRLYGAIELVLVVVVIATPVTFHVVRVIFGDLAGAFGEAPGPLVVARLLLAVVALAPATILMGATLPTLTRHLTSRRSPEPVVRAPLRGEHDRRDRRHARRRARPDRAARPLGGAVGGRRMFGRRRHRGAAAGRQGAARDPWSGPPDGDAGRARPCRRVRPDPPRIAPRSR